MKTKKLELTITTDKEGKETYSISCDGLNTKEAILLTCWAQNFFVRKFNGDEPISK